MSGYELKVAGGGGGGGPAPGGTSGGSAQNNPAATAAGGGGVKSAASPAPGNHGVAATGGGGGGGGGNPDSEGGNGGSGIAVIRYQIGSTQTDTAKATGGSISYSGGKTIHQFLSSGTFTITNPSLTSVDYLVVAGGGGGGFQAGGGGGAGGFRTGTSFPVSPSPGVYSITVGAGGGGAYASTVQGVSGSNSGFIVTWSASEINSGEWDTTRTIFPLWAKSCRCFAIDSSLS